MKCARSSESIKPARLQHMARQEKAGERKAVGKVASAGLRIRVAQEGRQAQHLVGPGSPASRETARPDFGET